MGLLVDDRPWLNASLKIQKNPQEEPRYVVVKDGWRAVRDQLVRGMDNCGIPVLSVKDGGYKNSGELYLAHEFDGRTLDPGYIGKTLPHIYSLWQRPVHIETRGKDNQALTVYSYNGKDVSKQVTKLS